MKPTRFGETPYSIETKNIIEKLDALPRRELKEIAIQQITPENKIVAPEQYTNFQHIGYGGYCEVGLSFQIFFSKSCPNLF